MNAITEPHIKFLINPYSIFLFKTCIQSCIEFEIYLIDSTILFLISPSVFSVLSSEIIFIPISSSSMLYILSLVFFDKKSFQGIRNSVVGNFFFFSKILSSNIYFDIYLEKKLTIKISIDIRDTSCMNWNQFRKIKNSPKSFLRKKK